MLTPEYLQGLPDELAALTENLETQLIEDIARRVAKAGEITDTAAYQIMRLKEMGASTEYIKKLLADYTKQSEDAIERMIFDAAQTDSEFYETVYARTGRSYVPYEYNDYLQQLAVAAVNQTKGELKNLTQSMGFAVRGSDGRVTFKPAAKAYQSAMDKAQMLVSTGGMDYITAVRMAVNDLAASGLRFVDYDSGIRNHADVAARRAVLTGVSQMTGKIAEHNAAQLGTDVVEVDAHAGARPDHAVWQGKWFSLTGKDKRYPLLSQATGYGTVTGLKGANCRHDFYPVIPGIDEPSYTEEELRNIDPPPVKIGDKTYTYYEAEQRQREMERAIRKTKRQIIAAQASGDTEQFTAKSILLRRQREQYADFSKKAGLVARNERTQVTEFGRSAGSKSSWAARKAKAKKGGSGSSGGHAVTVNVPTPADNGGTGKLYRDEGLDKSGGSGIIEYSEIDLKGIRKIYNRITDRVNDLKQPISITDLPNGTGEKIMDIINQSPSVIQKLFSEYPPQIYNFKAKSTPHYSSKKNAISLNFKELAKDERGAYTTAFHESGHFIDNALGKKSSSSAFRQALENDFNSLFRYTKSELHDNGLDNSDSEALRAIERTFENVPLYHSIRDIICGLTNFACFSTRDDSAYWTRNENRITSEAFAHFFEATARNDTKKINVLKAYFPSAYNYFLTLLR